MTALCRSMPFYRLQRHVVYKPGCQQTIEAWGLDRPAPGLATLPTPRDTDADDPLRKESECDVVLLRAPCGSYVTWDRLWTWLSAAEEAGYEVISGFKKLSPYSTIVIRGP